MIIPSNLSDVAGIVAAAKKVIDETGKSVDGE